MLLRARALKGTGIYHDFVRALKDDCYTADVLLLLTLARDVESLHLTSVHDHDNVPRRGYHQGCHVSTCPPLVQFLQTTLVPETLDEAYQGIRTITISPRTTRSYNFKSSHLILSPFFRLPNLDTVKSSGLGSLHHTNIWTVHQATSNVASLTLQSGNLHSHEIVQLLGSCKALRQVEICWSAFYELPGDLDDEEDPNQPELVIDFDVDNPTLLTALAQHAASLQHLCLSNLSEQGLAFSGQPAFTSLDIFQNLQSLELQDQFLIGDGSWELAMLQSRLPPSLRKLVIHSTHRDLENLDHILDACSQCRNGLEELEITFAVWEEMEWDWPALWQQPVNVDAREWVIRLRKYDSMQRAVFACWASEMGAVLAELTQIADENGVQHLLAMQTEIDTNDDIDEPDKDDNEQAGFDTTTASENSTEENKSQEEEEEENGAIERAEDLHPDTAEPISDLQAPW